MSTTTIKPTINFNQWVEKLPPIEPKSLLELHAEVGFPFAAKAIVEPAMKAEYNGTIVPIGEIINLTHVYHTYYYMSKEYIANCIDATVKRWQLLG